MSLKGQRFGSMVVLRDHDVGGQNRKVPVRCDCGADSTIVVKNLVAVGRERCPVAGCTDRRRAKGAA